MRWRGAAFMVIAAVVTGCGHDATGSSSSVAGEPSVDAYCAILDGATERASEETMAMLHDAALPEVADLLDRLARYESSAEDIAELGTFNEATCGVRWP